jgi:solute carrier family 25 S-adenosylmethionine transporter 26
MDTFSFFLCGAFAGITTDIVFFPLDTIKTRIQAAQTRPGQRPSLRGLYHGIGPVLMSSLPCGGVFFTTYYSSKDALRRLLGDYDAPSARQPPFTHIDGSVAPSDEPTVRSPFFSRREFLASIGASCAAESATCAVRVPFEVIKQRMQMQGVAPTAAGSSGVGGAASPQVAAPTSAWAVARQLTYAQVSRAYFATLSREVPFTILQLPLVDMMKRAFRPAPSSDGTPPSWLVTVAPACVAGFFGGGFAAALTTPIDVAKTRVILEDRAAPNGRSAAFAWFHMARRIAREEGPHALLRGLGPRVVSISIGGVIYFGAFETAAYAIGCGGITGG